MAVKYSPGVVGAFDTPPYPTMHPNLNQTLAVWVKTESSPENNIGIPLMGYRYNSSSAAWETWSLYSASGEIQLDLTTDTSVYTPWAYPGEGMPEASAWILVILRGRTNAIEMELRLPDQTTPGVVHSLTTPWTMTSSTFDNLLRMGWDINNADDAVGDIGIWNKILTDAEVTELAAPPKRFDEVPGLLHYWTFHSYTPGAIETDVVGGRTLSSSNSSTLFYPHPYTPYSLEEVLPVEITASNISHDSVLISWTQEVGHSYFIEYRRTDAPAAWNEVPIAEAALDGEAMISGLRVETPYEFRARASVSGSFGPYGEIVNIQTRDALPFSQAPLALRTPEGAISIDWDGTATSYIVEKQEMFNEEELL